jgi:hypothetical protein
MENGCVILNNIINIAVFEVKKKRILGEMAAPGTWRQLTAVNGSYKFILCP